MCCRLEVWRRLGYVSMVPILHAPSGAPLRVSVRLFHEVARRSYRRFSTYRGATFAGVFTNTVFGFLMAYVLLAVVHDAGGEVGGLDADAAVTYTFVAQGFLATVGVFGELGIGERIRTGDIVIDLYRPVDFQQYWLAEDLGRAAFQAHLPRRTAVPRSARSCSTCRCRAAPACGSRSP